MTSTIPDEPASKVDQAQRLHLDFLDGMRALAALYVVAYHYQLGLHAVAGFERIATIWLIAGHQAVDVFIVLSGFCLVIPIARTGQIKGGAMTFYARRYRRILPPYYASIVLSVLITALVLRPVQPFWQLSPKFLWTNLLLLQDVCANYTVNGVLWSVALECKIYLFFPFLVWLLLKLGPVPTLTMSALLGYGLAFAFSATGIPIQEAYPWYLFLFTLGMTTAWLVFKPQTNEEDVLRAQPSAHLRKELQALMLTGCFLVLTVALLLRFHLVIEGAYRRMPLIDGGVGVVTAIVLMALTLRSHYTQMLNRVLNWRPLVVIGTFAYSIYLIHTPLQILQSRIFGSIFSRHCVLTDLLTYAIGMPLIVGIAFLFFVAFERPFLNTRRQELFRQTTRKNVISAAP